MICMTFRLLYLQKFLYFTCSFLVIQSDQIEIEFDTRSFKMQGKNSINPRANAWIGVRDGL